MSDCSVLLVHDDLLVIRSLGGFFQKNACDMHLADGTEGAISQLNGHRVDLVVLELSSPAIEGTVLLKEIKRHNPEVPVWIVTAERRPERIVEAWRLGADEFLWCDEMAVVERKLVEFLENREGARVGGASAAGRSLMDDMVLSMMMIMSHDIRSPILSIGAMAKLLKNGLYGTVEGKVSDGLDELYSRVISLSGVVEDYLSRIALIDGKEFLVREKLDVLGDVIRPVLTEFVHDIRMFDIRVDDRIDIAGRFPIRIQANRQCIKAVFRNLLSNAVKYGGRGCTVRLDYEDAGSECRFVVFNSGPPIPEDRRDVLFTKFGKTRKASRTVLNGMGIGLFLVRNILREHGGDIRYEGEEDGSSFIFSLPKDGRPCAPCTRVESTEPPCGIRGIRESRPNAEAWR